MQDPSRKFVAKIIEKDNELLQKFDELKDKPKK
jgi:hypothetical protein